MTAAREALDSQTLDRIGRLRLVARTVVDSFISGQHKSAYRGFSVEFAQHRQYTRGDELRHIDWNVYGKSDRLFVKQYEEETNLRALLCLDASGSMAYGSAKLGSKFEYARKVAAALAYLMTHQADACGLVTFDTQIRQQVPPRSTTRHLSDLFKVMVQTRPGGETNLAAILHKVTAQLKRRGLVIILSDLFAPVEDLVQALAHLQHQRHEVILFQVLDPDELSFPFDTVMEFESLERDQHRMRFDAPRIRRLYLERLTAFNKRLREACHRFRFDYVMLTTDKPCEETLAHYLTHRRER